MEIFSARLKWLRERKGLTQKQIAEMIDMTQSSYSKYEYNLREPKLDILAKLPDILGESLDFLLGVTDFDDYAARLKLDYESSYMNVLQAENEISTLEVDPHDKSLRKFVINPDDTEEITQHIEKRKKYIRNWQKRRDISHSKLLKYLEEIPMVSDKAYSDIKQIEEWKSMMYDEQE